MSVFAYGVGYAACATYPRSSFRNTQDMWHPSSPRSSPLLARLPSRSDPRQIESIRPAVKQLLPDNLLAERIPKQPPHANRPHEAGSASEDRARRSRQTFRSRSADWSRASSTSGSHCGDARSSRGPGSRPGAEAAPHRDAPADHAREGESEGRPDARRAATRVRASCSPPPDAGHHPRAGHRIDYIRHGTNVCSSSIESLFMSLGALPGKHDSCLYIR